MRWPILLIILLCMPAVLAAELHGNIYTTELELATNVMIEINTVPQQRMLSKEGSYAFTITPGIYNIVAGYVESGKNQTSTETVTVERDGDFVFDLFLLPDIDITDEPFDEIDTGLIDTTFDDEPNDVAGVVTRTLLVIIVLAFFVVAWRLIQKRTIPEEKDETIEQVLTLIQQHGGRMTQKELRKLMPESEAKISLVITELEAAGKLQKIKKGRANILIKK